MTEFYSYLYGYIASRISSLSDTEEILQETYLAAVVSRTTLSDEAKLRAWLCGIADNKIKQYFRRRAIIRARHTGEAWEETELPVPDTSADRLTAEAALTRLYGEVAGLPPDFRNCADRKSVV